MDRLWSELVRHRVDHGRYPRALAELSTRVEPDPWGNAYSYSGPRRSSDLPSLASLGADGAPGGRGAAEDVVLRPGAR